MKYAAINIQGNILTSEILEKIRTEDFRYQKPIDFGFEPTDSIREEISLAWSVATSHWQAFKHKRENLRDHETGTTETRRAWMIPLLQLLGYDISVANAEIINGKSYAISHRATNLEGFPIHIVGINQSLDKRAESGGARLSPHALGQEYLNNNEHLYALVSNGKYLRLLRDATLLSRLSFVEFNLEQIMEDNLYAEFALLFRLLHASRLPQKVEEGPDSFLEFYHVEALASGSRIRERLSQAVEISIRDLANGLLSHPANKELREAVLQEKLSPKDFYLYNLRTIYRILFLLVIEDRKLIYPEKADEELNQKKDIYYKYYSLQRLTNLAENLIYVDPKKTDLWSSLLTTFSLFEYRDYGDKLGIAPLGSGLFHPSSLGKLRDQILDNETLLRVLRYLVSFENENQQRVRVNYADLDVEEFGSVYEGLLEYEPTFETSVGIPVFTFVQGDERSSSGSHYTPEELVKPLIDHSLQYQIEEKLKEEDPERGLLSLTVCDVACGSGHILLSAARRIGFELAKVRSGEDQPTPSLLRIAIRDVIKHCIYGVDLNPLAVELCKVALWLEAHQPGEPLNFLDHHIKCGNAIVGLAHFEELKNGIATEAFKTLPGDDSEVASTFRRTNEHQRQTKGQLSLHDLNAVEADIQNIQQDFTQFLKMPEHTPQQIAAKTKAYESLTSGKKWFRLKQLADLQVAQFFIHKTEANREKFTTEARYQNYLNSGAQIQDRGASMSTAGKKRFFHWFLEFPQVFGNGGFDCILGNPPYLGWSGLSQAYGEKLTSFLAYDYNSNRKCDLILYFLRRAHQIIHKNGFVSLVTTNSVSQGDTKKFGLEIILEEGGQIVYADKKRDWPGEAAVSVSLFSVRKSVANKIIPVLNGKEVEKISSYLDDEVDLFNPFSLVENSNIIYVGNVPYGTGFVVDSISKDSFIRETSKNQKVVLPYVSGDDLNSDPHQKSQRWVIFFDEMTLEEARKYTLPFNHLKREVYSERQNQNGEKYPRMVQEWWKFWMNRKNLNKKINKNGSGLGIARVTKYVKFSIVPPDTIYSDQVVVIPEYNMEQYAILNSSLHEEWCFKIASTMGSTTIRYSPNKVFSNFPFADFKKVSTEKLRNIGSQFDSLKKEIMTSANLGLTKLYNQLHNPQLDNEQTLMGKEDIIKKIKLLREIQKELDSVVLETYGWSDINLNYNFYEVEYLHEKDSIRFTIHTEARKEILNRLLKLNHERFEEEAAKGLHKKKDVVAYFKQKGEEIPEEIAVRFSKKKGRSTKKTSSSKGKKVKEPSANYRLDF